MANGLIGRKLGMTRVFAEDGASVPVTVIEAGPCRVVQVKPDAVQLGFESRGKAQTTRALLGHAKKAGLEAAPWILREFAPGEGEHTAGETVTVGIFAPGELVKVTGTSKGRGFQGIVKRHKAGGGPNTHGNTKHRKPGSIGAGTDPSRVIKGKKMPGQYGNKQHTALSIRVEKVDAERNLIYLRGSVAGPTNGIVFVRKQG
jgi:large subunit ribosomal protein L3